MSVLALPTMCNWLPFCHTAPKAPASWAISASDALLKFKKLEENADGFQYLSRLSVCIAQIFSPFCNVTALMRTMNSVDVFIAGARIVLDGKYFLGSKMCADFTKHQWTAISSNIAFAVSDAAASCYLLNTLGLVSTAEIAAALSTATIYGVAPLALLATASVTSVILYSVLIGSILLGIDSLAKIHFEGDESALTATLVSRSAGEIAHKIFLLTAGTFLATTGGIMISGVLGAIAAGMAVKSVYEWQKVNKP